MGRVELDEAFFRRESARLVAALTRVFGVQNLSLAEDVAQETLARAFESWSHRGVPDHAAAALMTAAKNRAIDVLRGKRRAAVAAPELARFMESEWTLRPTVDELFLPEALRDDELRMMFSCCQPKLDEEVQVALVLNVLGGLSAAEVAAAFLVGTAAMEKRLARGKAALAGSRRLFELGAEDLAARLASVHRAVYLLFSEGYHGASPSAPTRVDLCREAIRLSQLLVANPATATPASLALASLMCLHAARMPGRYGDDGELRPLSEQDRSRWDRPLLAEGLALLDRAATGDTLTLFHLEARIAALHAEATVAEATEWGEIVELYDLRLRLAPSPVVALSRAMAVAEARGPAAGLEALRAIDHGGRLARYPFFEAAFGELELRAGSLERARPHLEAARELARSDTERRYFTRRLARTTL